MRAVEKRLEFDFADGANVIRHDGDDDGGDANTIWPGVDFRVELGKAEIWLEIKDYSYHQVRIPAERRRADDKFASDLQSSEFRSWLVAKFLGTAAFLARTRISVPQQVTYVVYLDSSRRDGKALAGAFYQRLKRSFSGSSRAVRGLKCVVVDFDTFNTLFAPHTVRRS